MSALSSLSRGARGRANGERTLSSARFACASARVLSRGIIHINQLSACGAVTVDRKCAELAGAAALSAWVKCRGLMLPSTQLCRASDQSDFVLLA